MQSRPLSNKPKNYHVGWPGWVGIRVGFLRESHHIKNPRNIPKVKNPEKIPKSKSSYFYPDPQDFGNFGIRHSRFFPDFQFPIPTSGLSGFPGFCDLCR